MLGVLVFVHELGHFLAAKRVGIQVLKFQLGFNPTILSFRRGDTEYSIGALPLGGYVKMAGENPDDARTRASPDEFLSKTKWERFQVLIMGPAMNLGLARDPAGGRALPGRRGSGLRGAAAGRRRGHAMVRRLQAAGIQPGDRIVSVGGRTVDTWEDFYIAVGTRPNREVPITLLRDGVESTTAGDAGVARERESASRSARSACCRTSTPHIRAVNPGRAGREGRPEGRSDVIVAVNGEPITFDDAAAAGDREAPRANDHDDDPARRRPPGRSRRRRPATATRDGSASSIGEESRIIKPGLFEAMRMSVEQQHPVCRA